MTAQQNGEFIRQVAKVLSIDQATAIFNYAKNKQATILVKKLEIP
jgi:hypothetical protein